MEESKDNVAFSLLTADTGLAVDHDDAEQAEAEEDQRRRQQELQNMLAYAFDDIGEEENSTINSSFDGSQVMTSGIQKSYDGSFRQVSDGNLEEQYRDTTFNSLEQLQVLYQVQVREIQRLNNQLKDLEEMSTKEKNGLKKQLLLLEAEHNGIAISLQQCQEMLVEKNQQIQENEESIQRLKESLEKTKFSHRSVEEEVQIWMTKSTELEQKLGLIEKGLYVPVSERQIRAKYEQDISELQNSLEQAQKTLEQTQKNKVCLENEIKDIKQQRGLMLMEKEDEIHSLFSQLENSKYQCLNLTDRVGFLEKEHQNLTNLVNTTTNVDTTQYSGSIKTLQSELKRSLDDQKVKRDEIVKLETKVAIFKHKEDELLGQVKNLEEQNQHILSENTNLQKENTTIIEKINKLNYDIEQLYLKQVQNDENSSLKVENETLNQQLIELRQGMYVSEERSKRIIEGMKAEMEKIKKNSDVQNLKAENEKLTQKVVELRKEKEGIEEINRIEGLMKEKKKPEDTSLVLKKENEVLSQQLVKLREEKRTLEEDTKKMIDGLMDEKNNIKLECQKTLEEQKTYNPILSTDVSVLNNQNSDLQKQLNEYEKEVKLVKNQLENYQRICLEMQETCAVQKRKLYESQSKVTELEGKLILKEKRDDLLDDLQQKAAMFEEYMKTKSELTLTDKGTNTEDGGLLDRCNALEKLAIEKNNQLTLALTEVQNLKEKVVFDRRALSELTEVWNGEITRQNNIIRELKKELELKDQANGRKQESVNEEISRMSVLISKLTESLHHKDRFIKDFQDKELQFMKEYENVKDRLKSDYAMKENRLLTEFERNETEFKSQLEKKEKHLKSAFDNAQKKFENNLVEIQDKINAQLKNNHQKFTLEAKIIESYYDLLIQQAKLGKKKKDF